MGYMVLISGKTGSQIIEIPTPNNREIYFMPQLLVHTFTEANTTRSNFSVLFGTGGQDNIGALYVMSLSEMTANKKVLKVSF